VCYIIVSMMHGHTNGKFPEDDFFFLISHGMEKYNQELFSYILRYNTQFTANSTAAVPCLRPLVAQLSPQ